MKINPYVSVDFVAEYAAVTSRDAEANFVLC